MAYSLKEINDAVRSDPKGFAEACDAAFAKKVETAAQKIADHRKESRIILLSGPSGSGKTTTALKIEEQLEKMGIQTHTISMDNYFNTIDPETAPRNREGAIDYESPFCLDIELLNRHFSMLDRGETIHVPKYEFARQMRSDILSQPLKLGPDELAIFEGIHALNDVIVGKNPKAFKLYIAARSNVVDEDGAVVFQHPWLRLCRRIVRDYKWPLKMFCKQLLPGAATHLWACGRDAGIYYFGKADWERRGQIIPNAIEPETFRFSPAVRAEMRARYVLEDRVVLGHVGRFDVRKNHERLLEIFAAFLQLEPRAMLVLIGTGRLEQAVRAQAQELGIADHILFAGLQNNVADWYQMMDLFVMPSRFEGLPVVGIEAQAAGLGCVFSDAVPAEVLLSSHAIQIPLSASNADWAAGLQRMLHQPCDRSAGAELIRQAGYDINIAAARLQQQYLQLGGQA